MNINRTTLPNGLRLIHCRMQTTQMVAVNVLYRIGSANEVPQQTGFAHLFEHLMFGGTERFPDYDGVLQRAQGENNAYTTWDYTDYYVTLPAEYLHVALELELDRMAGLAFTPQSLEVQRKVVMEEFKQNYLNQPYGDVQHLISRLAFGTAEGKDVFTPGAPTENGIYEVKDIGLLRCQHPYSWPTIGQELSHIADATMPLVKQFFHRFYRPENAILVVTGNVEWYDVHSMLSKMLSAGAPTACGPQNASSQRLQTQPATALGAALPQLHSRRVKVLRQVPEPLLLMAFYLPPRTDVTFQACDMLSDVLSNGKSSRLNRRLVEQQRKFLSIDAYVDGRLGTGLLFIEGIPAEGVTLAEAEQAVWTELQRLSDELIPDIELEKVKNKYETNVEKQLTDYQWVAEQLAYFEMLGDARRLMHDVADYQAVSAEQLRDTARRILTPSNVAVLHYGSEETSTEEA